MYRGSELLALLPVYFVNTEVDELLGKSGWSKTTQWEGVPTLWWKHSPEGIKISGSCSFGQRLAWCPLTRCVENFHYINIHDQFFKRCRRETRVNAKHVFCALEMNCLQGALLGSSGCLPYGSCYVVFLHLWSGTTPAVSVQLCWVALCLKPGQAQLAFIPAVLSWAVCAPPGHHALSGSLLNASWGLLCLGLAGYAQKHKWLWDLKR